MQIVLIIVALAGAAIFIRKLLKKKMPVSMCLLWSVTSIGYGCAFFTITEGIDALGFGIMFLLANVLIVISSMIFGGNSFVKSLGICAKQLIVIVPTGLILGAIYCFAGNNTASILMTVGQYLFLATSLAFQILFSDPTRSL